MDVIAGAPAERNRDEQHSRGVTRSIGGIVHQVTSAVTIEFEGFDRRRLNPRKITAYDLPASFGGMSGGGVWRITVKRDGPDGCLRRQMSHWCTILRNQRRCTNPNRSWPSIRLQTRCPAPRAFRSENV